MQPSRILFIDAYDSFSNSIVALLRAELPVTVECIKIDDARFVLNDEAFFRYLDGFHAVVAGPGPGHPANGQDVGLIGKLWNLPEKHLLPVLGICLGFQSLCLAFDAKVERLKEPRHGIMTMIDHCNRDIYAGTGKIVATQYHSLHAILKDGNVTDDWGSSDLWDKSEECAELVPLSWTSMSVPNGPTLMGVRHQHKPYWGVQYHPESICTNREGQKLVLNWWNEACQWRIRHPLMQPHEQKNDPLCLISDKTESAPQQTSPRKVQWSQVNTTSALDVATIMDMLRHDVVYQEPLLLESGTRGGKPVNPETGRFSVIGLPTSSSKQFRYSTVRGSIEVIKNGSTVSETSATIAEAFAYLDGIVRANKAVGGPPISPFWGGLIGFISYEAGLQTIDVRPVGAVAEHPDLWFVFVERSIVVDHVEHVAYVQSIHQQDDEWLGTMRRILERCMNTPPTSPLEQNIRAKLVAGPEQSAYCQKVLDCQANLRAGESYELCLTDQSTLHASAEPWDLYKRLRSRNPAPFSAFLRLQLNTSPGLSIVGSSPERFLSWSREGKCQFRPIKGTVKKAPGITRAKAEELLASPKERAENLMIVDLIRHDLAGVKGIGKVETPKLMSVEEYETVFQLVSVIEGTIEGGSGSAALLASLPPGSMTGAPKKRSCELLSEMEDGKPRGLYSGVLGYFDVGGGGDFSVVIRTAFKWDDEGDDWHVGAGGAITALSDANAEWEEMLTKRESVLTALL